MKDQAIEVTGTITKAERGRFKVTLENDMDVTCTISGRLRTNKIKLLEGDKVNVELSPYDLTKGRIVWRFK